MLLANNVTHVKMVDTKIVMMMKMSLFLIKILYTQMHALTCLPESEFTLIIHFPVFMFFIRVGWCSHFTFI